MRIAHVRIHGAKAGEMSGEHKLGHQSIHAEMEEARQKDDDEEDGNGSRCVSCRC